VFAGYRKHQIILAREMLGAAPTMRDEIARMMLRIPGRTDRTSRIAELLRTTRRLARGLEGTDAQAYLALTQVAPLARTASLVRTPAIAARFEGPIVDLFERGTRKSQLQRTLVSDMANVLPNDMLTKVDRASMARHLEARVPLLDHRLVEIGIGLPSKLTLGALGSKTGKCVLRALHERHFGAKLANRKKQGFGVPVERWLRGSLANACEHFFSNKQLDRFGILSSETLGNDRWQSWRDTDPQVLWHCFALAAWCEAALGDGPDALRTLLS
jgi:asparagine synthase (glutamine-hydrolysing)